MATDRLLERTLAALRTLRERAVEFEAAHPAEIESVEPRFRNSARNLLHYLSVRQHDIRGLQQDLHSLGLSSLGILESHVLATLNAVIANLEVLAGASAGPPPAPPVDFLTGPLLLRDHARRLLGPSPVQRSVRIMVTMPSEAATNARLIEDLLRSGMDVMRDQLRPRRRGRLAAHGGEPATRRAVRRPALPDPGGSRRTQAAHGQHRAHRPFPEDQAAARRRRTNGLTSPCLADARRRSGTRTVRLGRAARDPAGGSRVPGRRLPATDRPARTGARTAADLVRRPSPRRRPPSRRSVSSRARR